MMIGEVNYSSNATVHGSPSTVFAADRISLSPHSLEDVSLFDALMTQYRKRLLDNIFLDSYESGQKSDLPLDAYSCEKNFRMFGNRILPWMHGRSHEWTEPSFAHPRQEARRRDPRKYHYSGTPCRDFRNGNCEKGDSCQFAHGVFESWLHPARYRTQPCKDGLNCHRRVCFFAHSPDQLRVLSPGTPVPAESYDGSPRRLALEASCVKGLVFMSLLEFVKRTKCYFE